METTPIDLRIKQLSYSSLLTLHSCPRKFQLYKLQSKKEEAEDGGSTNVTFAFGHIVGEGIQHVMCGLSEAEIIFKLFLGWHADLYAENTKQAKSFWLAVVAVQKFIAMRDAGYLQDYELVYHEGLPAVELSFCVTLPDGFRLRGYVDAVLRNKLSGQIMVLECKTTASATLNSSTYKNSAQAIGYSIVLDVLFPALSSYEVLYLIYKTKQMEYEQMPFRKSYLHRALWIQELLLDIETIKMYEDVGIYPMRGESCYSFYKECEYLNLCTLSTANLIKPFEESKEEEIYQINITLHDLVAAQLSKEVITS